jgi:HEAT repeat protein
LSVRQRHRRRALSARRRPFAALALSYLELMTVARGEEDLLRDLVVEATQGEEDEEAYWRCVARLQQGDTERVWSLLEPLVDHPEPRLRAIVPDVLRFLGGPERPLTDRIVDLFRRMLRREDAPAVLCAIGYALGELGHVASVELMVPFASHPDPAVRAGVVASLLRQRDPLAIETLILLSRDERDDVRDWATFGLGSQVGPSDVDRTYDDAVVTRLGSATRSRHGSTTPTRIRDARQLWALRCVAIRESSPS